MKDKKRIRKALVRELGQTEKVQTESGYWISRKHDWFWEWDSHSRKKLVNDLVEAVCTIED